MEKPKTSAFDIALDAIHASGQAMAGRLPKPEKMATPGMKKVAKALGDLAIFGWGGKG